MRTAFRDGAAKIRLAKWLLPTEGELVFTWEQRHSLARSPELGSKGGS